MPIKRYNRKKRSKPTRLARYARYGGTAISLATKALTTAIAVRKLLNVEYKNFDYDLSLATLTALAQWPICYPTQGDTATTREGRSIRLKTMNIKYILTPNSPTQTDIARVRVMIVQDKMPDGSFFPLGQLLNNTSTPITSFRALDYSKRFMIHYDKTHVVSPDIDNPKSTYTTFTVYRKMDTHIKFDATVGNIGDISANAFYIVFIPDSGSATAQCKYEFQSRCRYLDN